MIKIRRWSKGGIKQYVKCPICGCRCYCDWGTNIKSKCGHLIKIWREDNPRIISAQFSEYKISHCVRQEILGEIVMRADKGLREGGGKFYTHNEIFPQN